MAINLFLIFNHQFTSAQDSDARASLGLSQIVNLPGELQGLWSNIPPNFQGIRDYLNPIQTWLTSHGQKGDYVLVQGDFGACYLMVNFAFEKGLIPIYSTTDREMGKEQGPDGSVKLTHYFRHRMFKKYGD